MSPVALGVADEVAEALGHEPLAALRRQAGEYWCAVCRVHGDAREEATNLVLVRHPQSQRVVMVHAGCAESQIAVSDESLDLAAAPAGLDDVVAMAGLIPERGKMRPWLFIERQMGATIILADGSQIDPWFSNALDQGWGLMMAMDQRLRSARAGWRVALTEDGRGHVLNDEGMVLLDRLPPLAPGWLELARRGGFVNVVVGRFNVQDASDQAARMAAIEQAISNGAVAGSRVKVTRADDQVDGPVGSPQSQENAEDVAARRAVAEMLEQILRTRADPDADDLLNQGPMMVPLPTRPVLSPFGVSRPAPQPPMPALVVDLNDPDLERGKATMAAIEKLGIPRRRPQDNDMVPDAPEGWSHLLWPSQILIRREPTRRLWD